MKKLKILHVSQLIGGLDIYIRNSIIHVNNTLDFVIIHGKGDNNSPIVKGENIIKEYQIDLYRNLNPWKDFKCLIQIIKIIHKEKPDIIHCHSAKGGFIGRIAGFVTNTKTYYTPHAFSFLSTPNKYKRKLYLVLEKIARLNSYLLACSESEYQLGIDIVKYKKDHAFTWSNSVPQPHCCEKEINNIPLPYICCIGRPSYQKNTLFLVDVINEVHQQCPSIHFLLLGIGHYSPDLEKVEDRIKSYHLEECITLLPWLSHTETMEYVKGALFYLSTARYEGLPLAIIEAMGVGKAIIASDVPGNKDCVMNGYNGYLLPLDLDCFKEKIIALINDNHKRTEFGQNSKIYLEKQFNIKNRINILESIYLEKQ